MPRLSDSMSEATVVAWLKQPGESFTRGEPLFEVETDKATVVYEAEADGVLGEILVSEGETAALGEPVARLNGAEAENSMTAGVTDASRPSTPRVLQHPTAARPLAASVNVPAPPGQGLRARATPVARRTAAQLGISLHGLSGTGPGGRIRKLDVLRVDASTPFTGKLRGPTTVVELSTTGATIARRMTQSRSEIPSFDVAMDVDLSTVLELRSDPDSVVERVPSINDFIVKAVALTLREQPRLNSSFVDGRIELHGRVNVGVAVATDDALLVPTIVDADLKPLATIAAESRDLATRARSRQITPDDLAASTFTVSNMGMLGARSFSAVINPPQVAILAVGAVRRAPTEGGGGAVVFRDVATFTLTSDHRAVYGADAARFLTRLRQLLEHPLALVL
jgi:pyruvate dehydrogenase E2 component (dihydrolipoamide acetyltransferase)